MAGSHRFGLDEVVAYFQELEDPLSEINRKHRRRFGHRFCGCSAALLRGVRDQNVLVVKRCVPLCVRRCSACFGTCPCPVRQWRFTLGGYLANLEMVAGFTWKVLAMARQLSPAVRRLSASAC